MFEDQQTPSQQQAQPENPMAQREVPPAVAAPRTRLSQLSRGDIKVVFRPRGVLSLTAWKLYHITDGIAQLLNMKEDAERAAVYAQIHGAQNIAVISIAQDGIAYKLLEAQAICVGGKSCPTNTYVAAPDNSIEAVVHGIRPNTSSAKLIKERSAVG
ncbi:hypothetical protein IscW_ISCW022509 [Ixodes scapularis]|uniref:Uncharacterized protein n=1 Tax=Ixodes scapularis TaxID=6945 RepID=B7QB77_IXOSC|nr:hypothetical protein IscW_ISCW022509 [Ixodes scapularis]|eukprot:XP_002412803.1 hypothetical protein IscW_ISCW022509 [Ixodes scapularis]